ncbi:NUDIX domain-containing protein [Candidatus Dojkabacteria bacterium]|nr:NUDIX domain-containing protein [Candidatus Dojkabacteria bacterium]
MEIKLHITAGCFLVRPAKDSWEIVLLYKKWTEDNQGWVPPKGHVEEGETLEQAARRETMEETGYKNFEIVSILETLHIKYSWNDGCTHKKDIHYFLAKLLNDEKTELKLSEQEENSIVKIEWLSLEKAEKDLLFDDEREILRKVIRILNTDS